MATTIWQLSRDDLVTKALQKLGVLSEGQAASSQQLDDGADALNLVLSDFQSLGLLLWKRRELDVALVAAQSVYTFGVGEAINTPFPLKIQQVEIRVGTNAPYSMIHRARQDFNDLPSTSTGTPNTYTYQPLINVGELTVWPTPDTSLPVGSELIVTYQEPVLLFESGAEILDFPQEWGHAVIYQLAHVLSDDYSLPLDDRRWLEKQADKRLATAAGHNVEDGSIGFYPVRE